MMLTKAEIETIRKENKPNTDAIQLIWVYDAMRAFIQDIADGYGEEKPDMPKSVSGYPAVYKAELATWIEAKAAREFLARLDAGMPEETASDNMGDIPF